MMIIIQIWLFKIIGQRNLSFIENDDASVVLTIDADGQHPIDIGEKMISLINDFGYHVVLGTELFSTIQRKTIFNMVITNMICLIFCVGMKCYSFSSTLIATGVYSKWNSLGTYITINLYKKGLELKQ